MCSADLDHFFHIFHSFWSRTHSEALTRIMNPATSRSTGRDGTWTKAPNRDHTQWLTFFFLSHHTHVIIQLKQRWENKVSMPVEHIAWYLTSCYAISTLIGKYNYTSLKLNRNYISYVTRHCLSWYVTVCRPKLWIAHKGYIHIQNTTQNDTMQLFSFTLFATYFVFFKSKLIY